MKIAFLFTGQYRYIPYELMHYSISNLTKGLDYDIFCYSWDESGESLDHRENIPKVLYKNNSFAQISKLFSEFNLKKIKTESYQDFINNLPENYKNIFYSDRFHKGTINALPQIYTLSKCYELLMNDKKDYDMVFRCRFDSIYLHPLKLYPLKNLLKSNNLYNINFGRAYYPNRVYDIFFGGSKRSMQFLEEIWRNIPIIIENNFYNGLDRRDACRLIYISATSRNIKIKSLNTRICDIYRPFKDYYHEQYLISSHLFSLKPKISSLRAIPYIIKWLIFRRINLIRIFLLLTKTIFLMPISYLKRLKFLIKLNFTKP